MIKNIVTTLVLGACALSAAGQQVDGDFDGTWKDCKPWTGGETTTKGKNPPSWCISHIVGYKVGIVFLGGKEVGKNVTGYGGKGKAVQLTNTNVIGSQNAPAYLTLGTSWNTANTSGGNADGGSWGGKEFKFKPDAISFHYKRTAKDNSQPASVVTYLWKGTFKQENVPSNVSDDPTMTTMVNRDRCILNNMNDVTLGGAITEKGTLVATIHDNIYKLSETKSSWTECVIPLEYVSNEEPEYINIIFSANDYFAPKSDVKASNTLTIDNVQLLYYHTLATLAYDGEEVADFDPETTEYDLSDVEYDASKLSYEKNGVGATVEKSYDDESAVLTITVKGNNYVEGDEDTYTTYTIQFKKPMPQGIETEYQNGLYIDARKFNNSGEQFEKNKTIKLVNYPDLDNRYDLLLNDFVFYLNGTPLNVGDILVKDLDKTQEGNVLHLTTQSQLVEINGLGSLAISVDATLENSDLTAKIAIEGLNINVTFAPAYNLTDGVSIPTTSLSNLQFTRTFKSGWNTLILPFATTAAQLGAEEVDQLSSLSTNHNWVNFEEVESGELAANVPYLVKFADAQEVTLYYGGEVTTAGSLTTTASATSGNGQVSYVGNYVASMDMNGKYGLYMDQIVQGGTNALLPSTACYFDFKNIANPAALSVKFGNGETTSISTITAPAAAAGTGVYNLQGIKLNNTGSTAGLPAGLYIVNGQKVLVK